MFAPRLDTRQCQPEWMDDPNADPEDLRKALITIRRINHLLGYTWTAMRYLDRFAKTWEPNRTYRIVDLATGSGDLAEGILNWANRRGRQVEVIAVDLHQRTLETSRQRLNDPRLIFVRGNALELPFAAGGVDYVFTSLFLHHLSNEQIVRSMQEMARVAAGGLFIADLLRKRRAYAWIKLMTAFCNPITKHDAPVSVAQSFTREEIVTLRDRAGLSFAAYAPNFGHRFVLAGHKQNGHHA